MSYVASLILKNGEVIDLTSKQYSLNNIGVPWSGMTTRLKEQGRRTEFVTQKKKEEKWRHLLKRSRKSKAYLYCYFDKWLLYQSG